MSLAVWLGEERKCSAAVVGLDLLLGLSMVRRCSLNRSFKRRFVSFYNFLFFFLFFRFSFYSYLVFGFTIVWFFVFHFSVFVFSFLSFLFF